ncbi:hypothetical protein ACMYYO_12265 [Dermacoccaceae bacterium W4C1]
MSNYLTRGRAQVALVIVAVLLAGVAGWWVWRGQDAGAVWNDAQVSSSDQRQLSAPLPMGSVRLDVSVGTSGTRADDDTIRPPAGGRLVRVSWTPRAGTSVLGQGPVVWPGATAQQRREVPARIEVRTQGRSYVVATDVLPSDSSGTAVVAVEGDADLKDVEVATVAAGRRSVLNRKAVPIAAPSNRPVRCAPTPSPRARSCART